MTSTIKWAILDTYTIAKRNITRLMRLPQLIIFSTVQPVMFVLLFAFVFGGAINTPNGDYINYLLPGILVQTVLFGGVQTTIGLADDLSKGMINRFRSLPMNRAAVLAGRTLADASRNAFVVFLMIAVGYLIGFSFQGGFWAAALAILILILFGYAFSWIAATIALIVKDPEAAQSAGFVWIFPLAFASSIFVPVETMDGALRTFAENQPVSIVVNVVRDLSLYGTADDLGLAFAWIFGIFAVAMPISVIVYKRN